MSIRSLFTSHEELFAQWMMHNTFNDEIHAEPRFPQEDSKKVQDAYFTLPDEYDPSIQLTDVQREKVRAKRLTHLTGPLAKTPDVAEGQVKNKVKSTPKKQRVYHEVHGKVVEKVEKLIHPEIAKYGHLWSYSHYKISDQVTGYYLIEGWLVVSIPEKKEEKKFEMDHGDSELRVVHSFADTPDQVGTRISVYLQRWFAFHKEKLWIVFATCLSSAMVMSLTVVALGNSDNFYGILFSKALLIGAIAMKAMMLYTGIKLLKLQDLEDKTLARIHNLGDWVQQVRVSAGNYPTLAEKARIAPFFTKNELVGLKYLMNKDTSITGYIHRFFERISCLQSSKQN